MNRWGHLTTSDWVLIFIAPYLLQCSGCVCMWNARHERKNNVQIRAYYLNEADCENTSNTHIYIPHG